MPALPVNAKLTVPLLFKETAKVSVLMLVLMGIPTMNLVMMPQALVVVVVADSSPVFT